MVEESPRKRLTIRRCGAAPFTVFDLPPVFAQVRESKFNEISSNLNVPFTIGQADTLIRFSIPATTNKWLSTDLVLHTKVKLLKEDGGTPADGTIVSCISNLLNGLWSKAIVSLNDTEVYTCANYGYISYLTNALMLSKEEHARMNATECFYLDQSIVDNVTSNKGWNTRTQCYANGATVEMMGVLRLPLFGTSRFLPHGVRIDLTLYSQAPAFFIQAAPIVAPAPAAGAPPAPAPVPVRYKLQVDLCQLHYQSLDMSDDFLNEYQIMFDRNSDANLPFLDYKSFVLNMKAGIKDASSPQYTLSHSYPRRIFVGFVSEAAFQGSQETTPWEFKHFNAEVVKLKLGEFELQQRTDQTDNANSEVLFHLYKTLGWTNQEGGCYVSRIEPNTFKNTHVYAFDCTPAMNSSCLDFYQTTPKSSMFSIDVSFKQVLPVNVSALIVAEIDQILAIRPDKEPLIFAPPVHEKA